MKLCAFDTKLLRRLTPRQPLPISRMLSNGQTNQPGNERRSIMVTRLGHKQLQRVSKLDAGVTPRVVCKSAVAFAVILGLATATATVATQDSSTPFVASAAILDHLTAMPN